MGVKESKINISWKKRVKRQGWSPRHVTPGVGLAEELGRGKCAVVGSGRGGKKKGKGLGFEPFSSSKTAQVSRSPILPLVQAVRNWFKN